MLGKIEYIYWDSCIFIDYLQKTPGRISVLDNIITNIYTVKKRKIITSILSKTEVAYVTEEKHKRTLNPIMERQIDSLWKDRAIIEIVDFHTEIALLARTFLRASIEQNFHLKPPDAIHLASALWLHNQGIYIQELQTYDQKLQNCSHLVNFPIREPHFST